MLHAVETYLYNTYIRLFSGVIYWYLGHSFNPILDCVCNMRNNLGAVAEEHPFPAIDLYSHKPVRFSPSNPLVSASQLSTFENYESNPNAPPSQLLLCRFYLS